MWEWLCECLQQSHPNINEIMQNLQELTVCTGTQCFETMQDAGFGTITTTQPTNLNAPFFLCMFTTLILIYQLFHAITLPAGKPQNLTGTRDRI